jgi:CDP-paratose 2-epimerase
MNQAVLSSGPALVTGGAGFIGTNLVLRLVRAGVRVIVLDNFSRRGVGENAAFISAAAGPGVEIVRGDCRDRALVSELVRGASQVFHFAAQVAVTTSLEDPELDFDVNAHGTLTLLEALRKLEDRPPLVFTSTNKVYGDLHDVALDQSDTRYEPSDAALRARGVSENQRLSFHSPYGCSKGAADQYVLDYAKTFGLPAVVFRMSCIYGPHQRGNEDQGWVAHFLMRALARQPITLYGDGRQVRDVLFVDDLVDALLLARDGAARFGGTAFNIGGGPENSISLLELLSLMEQRFGCTSELRFAEPRRGDQRYYVSDTDRFRRATGWVPTTRPSDGIRQLHDWLLRAGERGRVDVPRTGEAALIGAAGAR